MKRHDHHSNTLTSLLLLPAHLLRSLISRGVLWCSAGFLRLLRHASNQHSVSTVRWWVSSHGGCAGLCYHTVRSSCRRLWPLVRVGPGKEGRSCH